MCVALARLQLGILTLFYGIAQALSLLSRKEALSGIVGPKEFCTGCRIGFDTRYIPLQSADKNLGKMLALLFQEVISETFKCQPDLALDLVPTNIKPGTSGLS